MREVERRRQRACPPPIASSHCAISFRRPRSRTGYAKLLPCPLKHTPFGCEPWRGPAIKQSSLTLASLLFSSSNLRTRKEVRSSTHVPGPVPQCMALSTNFIIKRRDIIPRGTSCSIRRHRRIPISSDRINRDWVLDPGAGLLFSLSKSKVQYPGSNTELHATIAANATTLYKSLIASS